MFKKNMNNVDRIIRVAAGAMLVYFGFFEADWITITIIPLLLGVIGVANLAFASSGFCPFYALAGYNFANQEKVE